MDAKSIRFPLSVRTWRCDLECCGHVFCLSVSTAFINTGQGRGGFYSSLLWQTDALSLCFFIWNFPVEERRKLLLRALYSSLKQLYFFWIYRRSFAKHSCPDHLAWKREMRCRLITHPFPLAVNTHFHHPVPLHPPNLRSDLCWTSSFQLSVPAKTAINLDFEL